MTGKMREKIKKEITDMAGKKRQTKDTRQTGSTKACLPRLYLVCNSDYRLLSPPALIEE